MQLALGAFGGRYAHGGELAGRVPEQVVDVPVAHLTLASRELGVASETGGETTGSEGRAGVDEAPGGKLVLVGGAEGDRGGFGELDEEAVGAGCHGAWTRPVGLKS